MENIYSKVSNTLDEKILGCKVQKIKRDAESKVSISYILHPSIPREYINDKPTYLEHEVQIDVWTDYEVSNHTYVEKIVGLMRSNGFGLVSIRSDMYEPETNIIHKPLLFKYLEKLN